MLVNKKTKSKRRNPRNSPRLYSWNESFSPTPIVRLLRNPPLPISYQMGKLVLPRVLPKEKTTGERLQGVLHDLGKYILALVPRSQQLEGQAVLHSVTAFVNNLLDYFADHLSDVTQLTPCIVSQPALETTQF
jgi:hypothetical protein